jgi:hypothetical protein
VIAEYSVNQKSQAEACATKTDFHRLKPVLQRDKTSQAKTSATRDYF